MKLIMEEKVFYRSPQPKLFIWLGGGFFILLILNLFFNKEIINTNSIFLFTMSLLYLAQHFYHKSWVLKIDSENIYIRDKLFTRANEIPYSDIHSYKVLVTGDIELKLQDKEVEISKDIINEADFQEILDKINQATQ